MNKLEFEQAIRDEYQQAEENISELIHDVSQMTVEEVLSVRDRVIHSSIQWYVQANAPQSVKEEHAYKFMQLLTENIDSDIATVMFNGYGKTLKCEAPL
jgi:CHASE3 domain sensor protein